MGRAPLGFPSSFAPRRYRRRTSRAGPGHRSTDLELRDHIRLILQSGSSLVSCDRRRTVHPGRARSARAGARSVYESDSAGVLAAGHESRDRQAPSWPEVGAGVAPEFMPKRNSGPIRRRGPMGDDAALSRLATSESRARFGDRPCFPARAVLPEFADGGVAGRRILCASWLRQRPSVERSLRTECAANRVQLAPGGRAGRSSVDCLSQCGERGKSPARRRCSGGNIGRLRGGWKEARAPASGGVCRRRKSIFTGLLSFAPARGVILPGGWRRRSRGPVARAYI